MYRDHANIAQLIGEPAAEANSQALRLRLRLWLIAMAGLTVILISAVAQYRYYYVFAALIIGAVAIVAIPTVRQQRTCGQLAAQYLSTKYGFPIKVGLGGMQLRGWRSCINLQLKRHQYALEGKKLPFIQVGFDKSDPNQNDDSQSPPDTLTR